MTDHPSSKGRCREAGFGGATAVDVITVDERIEVPAAPAAVWEVISDPRVVVSCVPGASITSDPTDGEFDASLVVRFGPTRVTFNGHAALELDPTGLRGRLTAHGTDTRRSSRLRAAADFGVSAAGGGTGSVIPVHATVEVSGRLAGLIEDGARIVVRRMSAAFAELLAARCAQLHAPSLDQGGWPR